MKKLGHLAFAGIEEEVVRRNAAALPEDGIPPEVYQVIQEVSNAKDSLQPQKAATPTDGMHTDIVEAGVSLFVEASPLRGNKTFRPCAVPGAVFAAQRPRAVVAEGQSLHQAHEVQAAALQDLRENMMSEADRAASERALEIRTGNKLLDQFESYYWCVAFCFLFPYATAGPDVQKVSGQHVTRRTETRLFF